MKHLYKLHYVLIFMSVLVLSSCNSSPLKNVSTENLLSNCTNSTESYSVVSQEPELSTSSTGLSTAFIPFELLYVPEKGGTFKAWEDKNSITDDTSAQYKLLQTSSVDGQGFMRLGESYLVAMGTYYGQYIGQNLTITLSTGVAFDVVIGDVKDDKNTIDGMVCRENSSIVEFIIDKSVMKYSDYSQGNLSHMGFEGYIISIARFK